MIHTAEKDKYYRQTLITALYEDFLPILNTKTTYHKKRLYEAYKCIHPYSEYRFNIFIKVFLNKYGYTMIKETPDTFKLFNRNTLNF